MSGIGTELKSKLIDFMLSKGISTINDNPDVRYKIKESMHGEDRTLLLKIKGFNTMGFGVRGDELVKYDTIEKPTVTVLMSEDVFIQLVRGKISFREAFFYGDMDVTGDDWLREFVIFNTIFEQFGYIAKEMGI